MKREPLDTTNGYPEDYHDYVFKNGRLVGAFDEMYRYAKDVPWHQDKDSDDWYSEVGLVMLRDRAPFESILEMGCGLGYFTEKLRTVLGVDGTLHAFDISAEAIRKARDLHEGIEFRVDDITNPGYSPERQYDLVVIREVFWYVFDQMDNVLANVAKSVKKGGFIYVRQLFPALDGPFVGKNVIPDPDALIGFFLPGFKPVYSMRCHRYGIETDGPVLHVLFESVA